MYCEEIGTCIKWKLAAGVVVYFHRKHASTSSQVLPLLLYIWRAMDGWVKYYRKTTEKAWYKKPGYAHLWSHILLMANHKQNNAWFNGKEITVQPGQFITGRKKLSKETGIDEYRIIRILSYFEKTAHQIAQQKTGRGSLITILNWKSYQETAQQTAQQLHNNCTTTAHKQESKECKEVNTTESSIKKSEKIREKENLKNIISAFTEISLYPKKRDALDLMNRVGFDELLSAIGRAEAYWKREVPVRRFRKKKSCQNFVDLLGVFGSDQSLEDQVSQERKWEKEKKPDKTNWDEVKYE